MLQLPTDSVKDANDEKVSELELDDAVKEVYKLHQEARRALEENRRYCNDLLNQQYTVLYPFFIC